MGFYEWLLWDNYPLYDMVMKWGSSPVSHSHTSQHFTVLSLSPCLSLLLFDRKTVTCLNRKGISAGAHRVNRVKSLSVRRLLVRIPPKWATDSRISAAELREHTTGAAHTTKATSTLKLAARALVVGARTRRMCMGTNTSASLIIEDGWMDGWKIWAAAWGNLWLVRGGRPSWSIITCGSM